MVDGPGDPLLPGARCPGDEDRGPVPGQDPDELVDLDHGGVPSHQAVRVRRWGFLPQPALRRSSAFPIPKAPSQQAIDMLQVQGLHQVIVGPRPHRLHGALHALVCGDDDDVGVR